MFDDSLEDAAQYYEDKKDDGSIVKHHRIRHLPRGHVSFDQTENVEFLEEEGPPREEVDIQDEEEILEDGTVHKIHKVRRHSLKHVRRALKSDAGEEDLIEEGDIEVVGTGKESILETFEEPPKNVYDLKEEEEVLEDGTRVKRKVIYTGMVQKIKTKAKSFDDSGQEISSDECEIEEVLPGTQAAFRADCSPSSSSSSSFLDDLDEVQASIKEEEETYDDGTQVSTSLLQAKRTRKSRSRSGSLERSEGTVTVHERRITPSHTPVHTPRSGSPVPGQEGTLAPAVQPVDDETLANLQSVSKTIRSGTFESTTHKTGDTVETTSELRTETFVPQEALRQLSEELSEDDPGNKMLLALDDKIGF